MRLNEYKDLEKNDLVWFKIGGKKHMGRVRDKQNEKIQVQYGPRENFKLVWLDYKQVRLWTRR